MSELRKQTGNLLRCVFWGFPPVPPTCFEFGIERLARIFFDYRDNPVARDRDFSFQSSLEVEIALKPSQRRQMVFVFPFIMCHVRLDSSGDEPQLKLGCFLLNWMSNTDRTYGAESTAKSNKRIDLQVENF
jgi:hypothetical protein